VVATRNNRRLVKKGDIVASVRVVPLVIKDQKLEAVQALAKESRVVEVRLFIPNQAAIVTKLII